MFISMENNKISPGFNCSVAIHIVSTTTSMCLHFFHVLLMVAYYVSMSVFINYIHCMPLPRNSDKWNANITIHICNE